MKFKWMKKEQKKVTKYVNMINKSIYNDPLWLGRFEAKQINRWCHTFEDGSGGIMKLQILFRDKKTGKALNFFFDNYDIHHIFFDMNDFIVHDVKVWDENPQPSIDHPEDFRNK